MVAGTAACGGGGGGSGGGSAWERRCVCVGCADPTPHMVDQVWAWAGVRCVGGWAATGVCSWTRPHVVCVAVGSVLGVALPTSFEPSRMPGWSDKTRPNYAGLVQQFEFWAGRVAPLCRLCQGTNFTKKTQCHLCVARKWIQMDSLPLGFLWDFWKGPRRPLVGGGLRRLPARWSSAGSGTPLPSLTNSYQKHYGILVPTTATPHTIDPTPTLAPPSINHHSILFALGSSCVFFTLLFSTVLSVRLALYSEY